MPIASPPNKYRPNEVCKLLSISKKTLYDLEARGIILGVLRDWRGWRIYDETHLEAIKEYQRQKTVRGG